MTAINSKLLMFVIILFISFNSSAEEQWRLISEVGNKPQLQTQLGSIDYEYEILKTEVTNRLYTEFLNAVAVTSDPHQLYTPLMEEHFWGGIRQLKAEQGYHYQCKDGYEDLPVVFVSWFDAVRYVNWLHYGKPNFGVSILGTTEGNGSIGAYNTSDAPDPLASIVSAARRNPNAVYWLPNRSEWIKAGFYGGHGKWWKYATQSDALPVTTLGKDNAANYYSGEWAIAFPHLSSAGVFNNPSWFGTVDQSGNAAEWIETLVNNERGWRLLLGGSLFRYPNSLTAEYYEGDSPGKKLSTASFRVARMVNAKTMPFSPIKAPNTEVLTQKEESTKYVTVGNPNNPPDIFYGNFGTVPYAFEMARYEISNQEWVEFLNAVATKDDPYGLYNANQMNGVLGGIERVSSNKGSLYNTKKDWADRPVTYIGWYDLARYANWLHYGRPNTGKSELGTTEGTENKGAYNTKYFEDVRKGSKKPYKEFGQRNVDALYWIPNQDEWYKAAYYDPTKLGARLYWDYPTRSDNPPDNPAPKKDTVGANYQPTDRLAAGAPFYLAQVNSYRSSASYYGTQQQGGNVWEWQEDWQYRVTGERGLRGGSFSYTETGLHAGNCDPGGLNQESYVFGGRLARRTEGVKGFPKLAWKKQLEFKVKTFHTRDWLWISMILVVMGSLFFTSIMTFFIYQILNRRRPRREKTK